jgi:nucleoside-diphosphate-sugar epimerase
MLPLLQHDDRIERIVGIARRPFDPLERGWTKLEYRRGDVRRPDELRDAFASCDVVVHLAFLITGNAAASEIRAINVEGTLNAFRAAAEAGASRFVYASSLAAYGFHHDNPIGMTEDWPVRPARRLFYAQEKAELEHRLRAEADEYPQLSMYLLRPSVVLGPNTLGGKTLLPDVLAPLGHALWQLTGRSPMPIPLLVPTLAMQFVHEQDVGQALLRCILGQGPSGAYNLAGDGTVTAADVARELGVFPLPLPGAPFRAAARAIAALPMLPPAAQWIEAASHPAIMNTHRAKVELGWRPRFTGLEALRAAVAT